MTQLNRTLPFNHKLKIVVGQGGYWPYQHNKGNVNESVLFNFF